MDLYLDGEKIDLTSFSVGDFEFEMEPYKKIDFSAPKEFSITLECKDFDYKAFKKLFKIPRKKKKKLGTLKARKRLNKKIRLGLPVTEKELNRAGYEVKK